MASHQVVYPVSRPQGDQRIPATETKPSRLLLEDYRTTVADYYRLKPEHLFGPPNSVYLRPMQMLVFVMREAGIPFSDIALFVGCNGPTVINYREKIRGLLGTSRKLRNDLKGIERILNPGPGINPEEDFEDEDTEEVEVVQHEYEWLLRLPHYKTWHRKANDTDSFHILRSYLPLMIKPTPSAPEPPAFVQPMTRDQWVNLLLAACAEYVQWKGTRFGVVPYYTEPIPLAPELIEHYVLDERIMLLVGKRNKRYMPSKHLLVFETGIEAFWAALRFDSD